MKIVIFLSSLLALICVAFTKSLNYNDKPKGVAAKGKGKKGKKANKNKIKPKKVGKNIFDTVSSEKGKNKKKKKNF